MLKPRMCATSCWMVRSGNAMPRYGRGVVKVVLWGRRGRQGRMLETCQKGSLVLPLACFGPSVKPVPSLSSLLSLGNEMAHTNDL